jgi:hypothetical protein
MYMFAGKKPNLKQKWEVVLAFLHRCSLWASGKQLRPILSTRAAVRLRYGFAKVFFSLRFDA